MKNREQLWEDYEEARFALLMDALAEAEGEEALRLSEALNRDSEGALPPEVDRRCEAVIRGAFVQRRLHATGRTAVRWLTKVLVAAMLGAVMFAAAFALSEDVRVATLNAVIEVMDDRTQITFEGAGGDADLLGQFFERIRPEGVSRLHADDGFLLHENVVTLQSAIVDDRVGKAFGERQNGIAQIVPTSVFAHETLSVMIDHDESGDVGVKPNAVRTTLRTARQTLNLGHVAKRSADSCGLDDHFSGVPRRVVCRQTGQFWSVLRHHVGIRSESARRENHAVPGQNVEVFVSVAAPSLSVGRLRFSQHPYSRDRSVFVGQKVRHGRIRSEIDPQLHGLRHQNTDVAEAVRGEGTMIAHPVRAVALDQFVAEAHPHRFEPSKRGGGFVRKRED